MFYLCSKNIGANQLRIYCAADLCFCFAYAKSKFSLDKAHMEGPGVSHSNDATYPRYQEEEETNQTETRK